MAYSLEEWRNTRQHTDNLPEVLGVSDDQVQPMGWIYFNERGGIAGYIETLGPGFYLATINQCDHYVYGDDQLRALEEIVWNDITLTA